MPGSDHLYHGNHGVHDRQRGYVCEYAQQSLSKRFSDAAATRDPSYQYTLLGQTQIRSPLRNENHGYTYQWNFSVQHQLPKEVALEASYSGLRGLHLFRGNPSMQRDVLPGNLITSMGKSLRDQVANPFYGFIKVGTLAQPTVQRGQLLLPYPQYQSLYDFGARVGDTTYHSLQMKAEKRFPAGGMLLAAYTFSKSIGNAETYTSWLEGGAGGTGSAEPQDYSNLRAERSLSSFDSRQRLTVSYVLDLPFGKGQKFLPDVKGISDKVISGWGINGMTTLPDGDAAGVHRHSEPDRLQHRPAPERRGGLRQESRRSGPAEADPVFQHRVLLRPRRFHFRLGGRTDPTLRGTGTNNFDFAVFKRTAITERYGLEFRLETFNLFNRVKFSNPNTTASTSATSTFGRITAQANTPRLLQLALRLRF